MRACGRIEPSSGSARIAVPPDYIEATQRQSLAHVQPERRIAGQLICRTHHVPVLLQRDARMHIVQSCRLQPSGLEEPRALDPRALERAGERLHLHARDLYHRSGR